MSLHHLVARRLAALLSHPDFVVMNQWPYTNGFGRVGQRLLGEIWGVQIFLSESATSTPSTPDHIAQVLASPDWVDHSKSIVYWARRRSGIGIRIEAWSDGRWYHVFIPLTRIEFLDPSVAEILELARRAA